MPPPLRDAIIARALELVEKGYSRRVAADVAGCTDRAVRNYLRRQGQPAGLWGGGRAPRPRYAGKWPCPYCESPVPQRGAVCRSRACRQRAWADMAPAERTAEVDRRRRTRPAERAQHQSHVPTGQRVDVHILLAHEQAEQLREQAALRNQSVSSLVAEALAEAGLIEQA